MYEYYYICNIFSRRNLLINVVKGVFFKGIVVCH